MKKVIASGETLIWKDEKRIQKTSGRSLATAEVQGRTVGVGRGVKKSRAPKTSGSRPGMGKPR